MLSNTDAIRIHFCNALVTLPIASPVMASVLTDSWCKHTDVIAGKAMGQLGTHVTFAFTSSHSVTERLC